ncbi:MAG: hypothetical protein ACYSU0_15275, partial [Planctomycetota bacterium]
MRVLRTIVVVAAASALSSPALARRGGRLEPVPCKGNPKYTYGVFLPGVYESDKDRLFPVLFTHSPGGNPGTLGMHGWAERRGVIIVSVNNYANAVVEKAAGHSAGWQEVNRIQDAVIESVESTLRVHPCLRFSMGCSGAGWASMRMAGNHNEKHAGVVMLAHSGNGADAKLKRHIAVAFIHAENDKVHGPASVRGTARSLKARGHLVREVCGDWGHSNGPLEEREKMMDWLLDISPLTHPNLPAEERAKVLAEIKRRIETLPGVMDPAERLRKAEALLALPDAEKWPEVRKLRAAWFAAKYDLAQAETDLLAKHEALTDLSQDERVRRCDSKDRRKLAGDLRKMRSK